MTFVRFGILAAALLLATGSHAAPPPEAAKLFKKCLKEADAGRHAIARTCFLKVWAIYKSPTVLYNLGNTEEALGNIVEAYTIYRRCAANEGGTLPDDARADVVQRLDALVKRLGLIAFPALPAGSVVLIDGKTRNPAVVRGIAVLPGDHDVRVEAPGMQAWSELVTLAAGQSRMLTVELVPVEAPPPDVVTPPTQPATAPVRRPPPPPPPPRYVPPYVPPPTSSPGSGLRATGLVLGSVGLAALVVGSSFGGLAMQKKKAAEPHCSTVTPDLCDHEGVALTTKAYNYALASTIAIAAGSAALGTGLVLYIVGHVKRRESPYGARVVPLLGPSVAGLTLQGGF